MGSEFIPKKKPTNLTHPVAKFKDKISQAYGVPNKTWYPLTGHHIGTDYLTPVGTSVLAPADGKIVTSGYSASLGNYCIYEYTWEGIKYQERNMHLMHIPKQGSYKQGAVIAKTGATGNVTGPHLHIDVFYNEVRLDKLTAKNWHLLTVDPFVHYS